ncbi:hypothetical protein EDD11_000404 [Mortierella claussenii]|nr:hypothetical protein EDD11_000404 [Mortierella claussenii]
MLKHAAPLSGSAQEHRSSHLSWTDSARPSAFLQSFPQQLAQDPMMSRGLSLNPQAQGTEPRENLTYSVNEFPQETTAESGHNNHDCHAVAHDNLTLLLEMTEMNPLPDTDKIDVDLPQPRVFEFRRGSQLVLGRAPSSGVDRQARVQQLLRDELQRQAFAVNGSDDGLFPNQVISKVHAMLYELDGYIVVEDRGSTHGTFVNKQRVQRCTLADTDVIQLGRDVVRKDIPYRPLELLVRIKSCSMTDLPDDEAEKTQVGDGVVNPISSNLAADEDFGDIEWGEDDDFSLECDMSPRKSVHIPHPVPSVLMPEGHSQAANGDAYKDSEVLFHDILDDESVEDGLDVLTLVQDEQTQPFRGGDVDRLVNDEAVEAPLHCESRVLLDKQDANLDVVEQPNVFKVASLGQTDAPVVAASVVVTKTNILISDEHEQAEATTSLTSDTLDATAAALKAADSPTKRKRGEDSEAFSVSDIQQGPQRKRATLVVATLAGLVIGSVGTILALANM